MHYDKVVSFIEKHIGKLFILFALILEELKKKLLRYLPNHIGYSRLFSLAIICGLGLLMSFVFVLLVGSVNSRWLLIGKVPKYKLKARRKGEYA